MSQSEINLKVGDRFRICEGSDFKIRYLVIEVDDKGGVICHDEREDGKKRRTIHCIARTPLEALHKRGAIEVRGEPKKKPIFDPETESRLKRLIEQAETALEFIPEGEAIPLDVATEGIVIEERAGPGRGAPLFDGHSLPF